MSQTPEQRKEPRNDASEHPAIQAPATFKAIVAVGVSGSGQYAWAKEFAKSERASGVKWLVLCRDELRLEILRESGVPEAGLAKAAREWDFNFSNPNEARAQGRWLGRARWAVEEGFDGVVCADSNLDGGRATTAALSKHLGMEKGNILRKLFDVSFKEACAQDAVSPFNVGAEDIAKQFHKLGRTLSLRKALGKAPHTEAWIQDPGNGFQTPKSLIPKPPKPEASERKAKPRAPGV